MSTTKPARYFCFGLTYLFCQLFLTDILFTKNHINLIGKGKRHIKFYLDIVLNGGKTFIE